MRRLGAYSEHGEYILLILQSIAQLSRIDLLSWMTLVNETFPTERRSNANVIRGLGFEWEYLRTTLARTIASSSATLSIQHHMWHLNRNNLQVGFVCYETTSVVL